MYWVSLELRFRVLTFLEIVLSPGYVSSLPAFSGTGANRQTVYGFAKGGTILLASSLSSTSFHGNCHTKLTSEHHEVLTRRHRVSDIQLWSLLCA